MRGSKDDLPTTIDSEEVVFQEVQWGDMHVAFEAYHQPLDIEPLFKGLPGNRCQCPHWGYVIKGRMRVVYADRDEIVEAGEAYYIAPGHVPMMDPGTEIVEFSPKDAYQKTIDVAKRNFETRQQARRAQAL